MTTVQEDRSFIAAVISDRLLEESIEWIANNLKPSEVFSEEQLCEWAIDNGFELPEPE